jgi:hypothetical protein
MDRGKGGYALSHIKAFGAWLGSTMGYLVIVAYIDGTTAGGLRGKPLWIFLNTFATGFNLTFEQFYFEVVFPILFIVASLGFISVWARENPYN